MYDIKNQIRNDMYDIYSIYGIIHNLSADILSFHSIIV